MTDIAILGLGNSVLGDDAVGLKVAAAVEAARGCLRLPAGVRVEVFQDEAGGWEILDYVEGFDVLILVDAILDPELGPGGLAWRPRKAFTSPRVSGVHNTDVFSALEFAARSGVKVPAVVHILGVGVQDTTTFSEECTPAVEAAIPRAADEILRKVEEMASRS
jgi:hydrogenase maturation protease